MSFKKIDTETSLGVSKKAKDKIVDEMVGICDAITDKSACDEILAYSTSAILRSITKVLSGLSKKDISRDAKIHIVATLTADLEDFVLPIHAKLRNEDVSKGRFDASRVARDAKAIEPDESIQVTHRITDEGQEIGVSIGRRAPKDISDALENYNADEIVGQS